jgi:hypothetical protein
MDDGWETAACQNCRQEFEYHPYHAGKRVRCDECNVKRRRERLEAEPSIAICQQCNREFTYLAWFGEDQPPKFCSDRCRKAHRANYMRAYRARVRQPKRKRCLACKARKVLRWTSQGFMGSTVYADGTLCSPHCFVEHWKAKLLSRDIDALDYDDRIQGLLNLRATPEQKQEIKFYLDADSEDVADMIELEYDDADDGDTDIELELDSARVQQLVNLKRSDGTL